MPSVELIASRYVQYGFERRKQNVCPPWLWACGSASSAQIPLRAVTASVHPFPEHLLMTSLQEGGLARRWKWKWVETVCGEGFPFQPDEQPLWQQTCAQRPNYTMTQFFLSSSDSMPSTTAHLPSPSLPGRFTNCVLPERSRWSDMDPIVKLRCRACRAAPISCCTFS